MKKHQFTPGSWVSITCLALHVTSAYAQGSQFAPHKPEAGPMKPKSDGKPGQMSERHLGPGEMGSGARQHPGGLGGPRGPGETREDMGRHVVGMHRDRDAGPPPFPRMGDGGVRNRNHPVLTPEQKAKRQEQIAKLRAEYGAGTLNHPGAKMELGMHNRRVARLERMKTVAEEQKKPMLIARIDALIKKEDARHQKRMEQIRSGDAGAPPGMRRPRPAQPNGSENKTGGQP